jgi:hypothetical protein
MSYDLIASTALTSAASSVTFSSIDQTYEDIFLTASIVPSANANVILRINGVTSASYQYIQLLGIGTTSRGAKFESQTSSGILFDGVSSGTRSTAEVYFGEYSKTNKKKSYVSKASSTIPGYVMAVHNFASTTAITSISLIMASGNFNSGTQLSLYGVR